MPLSFKAAIAALLLCWIGLPIIWPAPKTACRDGWLSPSIGRQGACSSHGGVARGIGLRGIIIFLSGPIAAYAVFSRLDLREAARTKQKQQSHNPSAPQQPPRPPINPNDWPMGHPGQQKRRGKPGRPCPKCGAVTRLRTARKGPNAGRQFWGCQHWPQCDGIISIHSRAGANRRKWR